MPGSTTCPAGWTGSDQLLQTLLTDVPWRAERRQMYDREVDVPRLLCWYSGDDPAAAPGADRAPGHALNDYYGPELGEPFVTAGLCLYRDGADSVAWHGDRIGRGAHTDTMVAILSVGSARALMLRPRSGGPSLTLPARARRPDRDGRQLPADLGARDPEDRPAGRAAGQHPVPAGRRRLSGDGIASPTWHAEDVAAHATGRA